MADERARLIEAVAEELGVPPLDGKEIDAVLDLAGAAAHGTGNRTAAPLTCFLAGLAAAGEGRVEALGRTHAHVVAVTAANEGGAS